MFETDAIHEGQSYKGETGAVIPPVYLTSTFAHGNGGGFDYTRSGNPNFNNLADQLGALEGAQHATVFAARVDALCGLSTKRVIRDRQGPLVEENRLHLGRNGAVAQLC